MTRELNDAKLRFQQFEVNTRYEREQELYNHRQEYEQQLQQQEQQQEHEDTEKLRQDYLSSVKKIQDASEEKIRLAQVRVNQMEQLLTRAEKKLSLLQNAADIVLEKQHEKINLLEQRLSDSYEKQADEGEREVGGILAGVMNTVEDAIRETEGENRKIRDKIIDGKLRGLKIQANHFKIIINHHSEQEYRLLQEGHMVWEKE